MKKYHILSILLFSLAALAAIPPICMTIDYFIHYQGAPYEFSDFFLIMSSLSCFLIFGGLTLRLKYQLTKD